MPFFCVFFLGISKNCDMIILWKAGEDMLYINTSRNTRKTCDFYFGLEEYLIKDYKHTGDIFLLWNVSKTVMIGRHQITDIEIDKTFVKENDISIVRRNSGGGAVYTDPGCFQFSFITDNKNHSNIFDGHVSIIVDAVNDLGLDASFTGRNDILVNGKKFSGNAEYIYKDKMVIHGTILFNSNFDNLLGSLTPDKSKLTKHAISSVKARVINLSELTDMKLNEFHDYIVDYAKTSEINLEDLDISQIEEYSKKFRTDEWNYGKNPKYEISKKIKHDAGNFLFSVKIKNNVVKSFKINGDYFSLKDVSTFEEAFINVEYNRKAFRDVIRKHNVKEYIYLLKNNEFLDTFFERKKISKPDYLKIDLKDLNKQTSKIKALLSQNNLHTVCQEASCPNQLECFSNKTATFMILGDKCTRNCKFCDVTNDTPIQIDPNEPRNIVKAIKLMDLKHVVITSVTRDDLEDYGSKHFVKCIELIRKETPNTTVEVLIPDFMCDFDAIKRVVEAKPDVINHNLETIKRLYDGFRDNANYERSLNLLRTVKTLDEKMLTKSGIMVGIGEKPEEVLMLMDDLRDIQCDIITIGQYLRPSNDHIEVTEYVTLETFDYYKTKGKEKGFKYVASGPLVRSSYQAMKQFKGE